MMKQKLTLITLLGLMLTLSGCFGIEEKVLIHKNGSGVFTYTLDCTKMITDMMEMVAKLSKAFESDSTNSKPKKDKQPEDVKSEALQKMSKDFVFNRNGILNSIKGISDCKEFADTTDGKFLIGISFNFDNISSLNSALKTIFNKKKNESKSGGMPPAVYSFKNGVLSRELPKNTVDEFVGNDKDDKMTKALMKDFKYVIVVESDNDITTATAPGAVINTTGKKTVIDYQVMDKNKEIVKAKMKSEVKVY
jgi:hypothetical protein